MSAGNQYELQQWALGKTLVGIDEAGRGPLAGPLLVAGVILPPYFESSILDDSKKLSETKRNELFKLIVSTTKYYLEIVPVEDIDTYDIYHATKRAMIRIAEEAEAPLVLTDAMPLEISKPHLSLIKGDHLSMSIAAASIIAKVTRDQIMYAYDELFPEYEFNKHKGYPTKKHLEIMQNKGLLPFYRKSYRPVRELL